MRIKTCFIFFFILSLMMGGHAFAAIDATLYSGGNADIGDSFDIDIYMAGPDEVVLARLIVDFDNTRVEITGLASHVGDDLTIPNMNEMNDFNTTERVTLTYSASLSGFVPDTEEQEQSEEQNQTAEEVVEADEEEVVVGKKMATITCRALAEGAAAFTFVSGTYIKKGVFPPEEATGTLTGTTVNIAVPIYTITASATPQEGGSISDPGEKAYEAGDEPVYTVNVNSNYAIDTFTVSGEPEAVLDENSQYAFPPLDRDTVIAASFKRQYKITASVTGSEEYGSISDPGEMVHDAGTTPKYVVTVSEGYIVDTFAVSSDPEAALDGNNEYTFPRLDQDAGITVSFKPRHKISAFATPQEGGTISDPGEIWYPQGAEPTYTVTPAEGYLLNTFTVSTDSDAVLNENNEYTLSPLAEDTVIIVTFKTQYKITASATPAEGGSISNPEEETHIAGTTPAYTVTVSDGYAVDSFTVSSDSDAVLDENNSYTFPPLAGDAVVNVVFRRLLHTINAFVKNEAGGTITPSGDVSVEDGEKQAFAVMVNEGWVIDKVVADGEKVELRDNNRYVFTDVDADHTLKVVFEEKTPEIYTVSASVTSAAGGSIEPSGNVSVEEGEDRTFTVNPESGWRIAEMTVDGEPVTPDADNSYTFKAVDRDFSIAVSFEQESTYHSADYNRDFHISIGELLRVIQLFSSEEYHCDSSTEDGFASGTGTQNCEPHDSDYAPRNWKIEIGELLRLIQLYISSEPYHADPNGEDGFGV